MIVFAMEYNSLYLSMSMGKVEELKIKECPRLDRYVILHTGMRFTSGDKRFILSRVAWAAEQGFLIVIKQCCCFLSRVETQL